MSKLFKSKELHKELISILVCMALSIIGLILIYKLWRFDIKVPLGYANDGDYKLQLMFIKRAASISDFFDSKMLGAPFSGTNYDYPMMGDFINILIARVFVLITGDLALGTNLFYFSIFPSTTILSYFCMKELGVKRVYAIFGGLVFTFLPYRFLRGTMHLFLNCYWSVPLALLLIIWLVNDENILKFGKDFWRKKNIFYLLICIFIAFTGMYYAFFTVYFVCVITVIFIFQKKKDKIFVCLLTIAMIGGSLLVGAIPYKVLQTINGKNPEAVTRSPVEAEYLGMKISQLIIPNYHHNIGFLKNLQEKYANSPVPNEGSEYLGIIGVVGFIILLLMLFINYQKDTNVSLIAKLNISAVLLGTIGGIGSLFALVVSPQIRAYDRISVFIAFFSISAVVLTLSQIPIKYEKFLIASFILICIVSIWDQSSVAKTNFKADIQSFYSDKELVELIENSLPEGSKIYNWIYQPYPENENINRMGDYASARGYIHSKNLAWSYGDQKGRESDLWNRELAQKSVAERIETINRYGFSGIWIDTYGMDESIIEEEINNIELYTGSSRINSSDGRIVYVPLEY